MDPKKCIYSFNLICILPKNYESAKIHEYLVKSEFELTEKIKFPFTEWEDRIYINSLKK